MNTNTNSPWPKAIASRIADEWSGGADFPVDVALLASALLRCFQNSPSICEELIGTGIIEESYCDDLK